MTLSQTLRATSQLISVCFSSVALAVDGVWRERGRGSARDWSGEETSGRGLTDHLVVRVGGSAKHVEWALSWSESGSVVALGGAERVRGVRAEVGGGTSSDEARDELPVVALYCAVQWLPGCSALV